MSSRAHQPSQQAAPPGVSGDQGPAAGSEQPYGNQAAAEDFGLAVRDYLESQGIPAAPLDEEGLPAWLSEDEDLPEVGRMHFGEPMLLAATTLPHFLAGLVDGLGAALDRDTLDAIHQKLAEGSLVAATIGMPWYLAGIVEGVAREVRDLVMLPLELPDLVLATEELIDLLSGPAGSEVARALGLDLADAIAGEAQDLLEFGPFDTARWLGLRVAPLVSDTLLGLLTACAATLAVRTFRVAARYLPDMKVLARLARSIDLPDLSPAGLTPEGLLVDVPDSMPDIGGAPDEALLALMRGDEGTDLLSDVEDIRRGRFEHEPEGDRLQGAFVEGLPLDLEAQGSRVTGKVGAGVTRSPRHHVFPAERRPWFEDHGFVGEWDIDHFCVELDEDFHQAIHGGGDWRGARELAKSKSRGDAPTAELQHQLDAWKGEWNDRVMSELDKAEALAERDLTRDEILAIVEDVMDDFDLAGDYVSYKGP